MTGAFLGGLFGFGLLLFLDGLFTPRRPAPRRIGRPPLGEAGIELGVGLAAGLLGAALALLATGWWAAAVVAGLLAALVPGSVRRSIKERDRQARREALAQVARRLRDATQAGLSLSEGLALAAETSPPILRAELRDLLTTGRSRGLPEGLREFARGAADPFFEIFAKALAAADRLGAGVSEILEGLAEAASAEARTGREVRARQTYERTAARIVAAAPALVLLAIRATNPEYLAPYREAVGQAWMLGGFSLIGFGYWASRAVARVSEGPR
ncbi:MAG: type II secretion system F family protein [bacterium]